MRRILSLAVLLLPSIAHADDLPVRPFVMPSLEAQSDAGVDLTYTSWNLASFGTTSYAAYAFTLVPAVDLALTKHIVVFARLPIVFAGHDTIPLAGSCCDAALGNITLGARVVTPLRSSRGADVGGEFAVSAPTASDSFSNNSSSGYGNNLATFAEITHDGGAAYLTQTTTLQFHGYGRKIAGRLFVEAGVGVNVLLIRQDQALSLGHKNQTDLLFSAAAGFMPTRKTALLAEITNIFNASAKSGDEAWIHAFDLGGRYESHQLIFGLHIIVPLDDVFTKQDMIGFGADVRGKF
jgi:hypothetical protein